MAKKILKLDSSGKLVLGLPGGATQPVSIAAKASAFLLIDCSSSMAGAKIAQAKRGALTFADDARKKRYSVGLISFASEALTLCLPEESFANLARCIETLDASGSTNMADAIKQATTQLSHHPGLRAIVIATDGMPDDQRLTLDAARLAKQAGIDIVAIGTDDADQEFLRQIASRSELSIRVPPAELSSGIKKAAKMLPEMR